MSKVYPKVTKLTRQDIEANIKESLEYRKGDFEDALQYYQENKISKKLPNGQLADYLFKEFSVNTIGEYSLGVMLYLKFLNRLSMIFFIMFLLTLPSILISYFGDGLSDDQKATNFFLQFTLANMPVYQYNTTLTATQNQNYALKYQEEMSQRLLIVSICDLVASIAFIIFIFVEKKMTDNELKDYRNVAKVSDYAVEVTNYPQSISDENTIQNHFLQLVQKESDIQETSLVRSYQGNLLHFLTQAQLNRQLKQLQATQEVDSSKVDQKMLQKLKNRIREMQEKDLRIYKENFNEVSEHDKLPSVKAFIIFNDINLKYSIIKQYHKVHKFSFLRFFLPCCYDFTNTVNQKYLLNKKIPIKLSIPDEPDNIIWQNQDATKCEQFTRRLISFIIIFLQMCITFAIVLFAILYGSTTQVNCPNVLITQQQAALSKSSNSTLAYKCFCQQLGTYNIVQEQKYIDFCEDYLVQYYSDFSIGTAVSVSIVIVNFLLKFTIDKLANFSLYKSVKELTTRKITQIFIAQLINTAFIGLIFNADIFGFKLIRYLSKFIIFIQDKEKDIQYISDLNRDWYINVGQKMINTCIIYIVTPNLIFFLYPLFKWQRFKKVKKLLLQVQMNEKILGPDFDISSQTSLTLTLIFFIMIYFSGMPIMLFFGALIFQIKYQVEKKLMISFYRRPSKIDDRVLNLIIKYLPYAVLMHLAIAIYSIGSDSIFPNNLVVGQTSSTINLDQYQEYENYINQSVLDNINVYEFVVIFNRAKRVIWLFALLAIMILTYLVKNVLLEPLKVLYGILCCRCFRGSSQIHVEPVERPSFQQELENLGNKGITSYKIRQNKQYKHLIDTIDRLGELVITDNSNEQKQGFISDRFKDPNLQSTLSTYN